MLSSRWPAQSGLHDSVCAFYCWDFLGGVLCIFVLFCFCLFILICFSFEEKNIELGGEGGEEIWGELGWGKE